MSKSSLRQLGLPGFELGDYIREAIAFLRQHEPPEGYYLGFSGGKDSIAMLHLAKMAGVNFQAFYCCTRIDPPEVMRLIRHSYPEVRWLFPEKSFWQMIREKMPPMRTARWCCYTLKKKPAANIPLGHRLLGIRAEESVMRAKYPRVDVYRKQKGQVLLKPIFHWSEWAVWEFIDAEHLPYPSLYDEGWSRIGCVVCPFIFGNRPGQIAYRKRSRARWPLLWKAFESVVREWFVTKGINGGLRAGQKYTNADAFWDRYVNGVE